MDRHIPVLQRTVLEMLRPLSGERVLDLTLGLGGHACAFLEAIGETGKFVGLDTDSVNLQKARETLKRYESQCTLLHANFRDLQSLDLGMTSFDVIFADLGLSSPHLDDPARGFSFRADGPLDLRFDRERGERATSLISRMDEEALSEIFSKYGELPRSKTLARALAGKTIATTGELRSVVEEVFRWKSPTMLPRVFQALRIAVNDEIVALEELLKSAPAILSDHGRLGIISYHSLEDRMVKQAFRTLTTHEKDPVTGKTLTKAPFTLLTKKPVTPTPEEISENPRSRSAKFRVIARQLSSTS